MAFYEIRRYEIRPGMIDEWVAFFEAEVLPFQIARGMVVCGVFRAEGGEDDFFWIRRFEDEAHRERLYAAVYQDQEWIDVLSQKVGALINRDTIRSERVSPQSMSVLQ